MAFDFTYLSRLYTRQELAAVTGIDDTTLNYWMRENLICAAEGGAGRGSHRRFPFHQVNLAAILFQLKDFGIGLASLRQIADRFNVAVAYMHGLGISRANREEIGDLLRLRKQLAEQGYITWWDFSDREKIFPDLPRHQKHSHMQPEIHLNWEQAVYALNLPHPERGGGGKFTPELVQKALALDLDEYAEHDRYFAAITAPYDERDPESEEEHFSTSRDYFYRGEDGHWHMDVDESKVARRAMGFIALDIERLNQRLWKASR